MDDRLNMSLDDIISSSTNAVKGSQNGIRRSTSSGVRNSGRDTRKSRPYTEKNNGTRNSGPATRPNYECGLKFMLPNNSMGSLIGNGGSSIRELQEITGAMIYASQNNDFFPGTHLRIVFFTGTMSQVSLVQGLIWEMVGQMEFAKQNGVAQMPWCPAASKASPGEYDEMTVEGHISVPAEGSGVLLGKQGSTLRSIISRSGATVTISPKEDGDVISERLLTITGTVANCMNATSMILSKLMELDNGCEFKYSGSNYPRYLHHAANAAGIKAPKHPLSPSGSSTGHRPLQSSRSMEEAEEEVQSDGSLDNLSAAGHAKVPGVELLSATTVIELGMTDAAVGAIIGKQRMVLNELTALSGASMTVSQRGEYVEGTKNRLVTITGSPAAAQTAHTLVLQRVRQELSD